MEASLYLVASGLVLISQQNTKPTWPMAVIPNRLYEYPRGVTRWVRSEGIQGEKILGTIDLWQQNPKGKNRN
jgi:hypothetical protein